MQFYYNCIMDLAMLTRCDTSTAQLHRYILFEKKRGAVATNYNGHP
jgi:hypothetical protein